MITIIQEPQQYTPAYNPMCYVVSSDNITQPSFQYVFDVWIKGVHISRHRLPPRVVTGVAMLDISAIVGSYVLHDFDINSTAVDRNLSSWTDVYIRLGEEYAVSGVLTTYINLLDTSTCYAINASLEYLEFIKWASNTYTQGSTRKFLTNIETPSVLSDSNLWLYFIYQTPENISQISVNTYSSSGVGINVDNFTPISLSSSNLDDTFLRVSAGTNALKMLFGNDFFDGAAYYTITIVDITSTFAFESKRINIIDENCLYTNIPVHFLNKLGGFDLFNFKLSNTKESDIQRKNYKLNGGAFNLSNEYIYSASDRGIVSMTTSVQDSVRCNSDWISEEENLWLKELATSPVAFAEIEGELVSINITETKFVYNKKENKKLFNFQIAFTYGFESHRQSY